MQSDWGINLMDVVTKGFEMVVVSKWMAVKKNSEFGNQLLFFCYTNLSL